jgi:alkylhydroperoxidase/carboxymuconolactone decarboxylase family protein YurZ
MAMRRRGLGDDYVDRAIANTTDFDRQFQAYLTEHDWGAVWGDDALKPRDRSILNLGMISCLGRMHEFEAHFRSALRKRSRRRNSAPSCGRLRSIAASRLRSMPIASPKRCWQSQPKPA